jgi:hypothetical protein
MSEKYYTSKKDWQNAKNNKSNKKSMGLNKYATQSSAPATNMLYRPIDEIIREKMGGVQQGDMFDAQKRARSISALRKKLIKRGIVKKS